MFNQRGDFMKKQIIFTLVVSLLSFGMIDSAMTSEIEIPLVSLEEQKKIRELELKKLEEERIQE